MLLAELPPPPPPQPLTLKSSSRPNGVRAPDGKGGVTDEEGTWEAEAVVLELELTAAAGGGREEGVPAAGCHTPVVLVLMCDGRPCFGFASEIDSAREDNMGLTYGLAYTWNHLEDDRPSLTISLVLLNYAWDGIHLGAVALASMATNVPRTAAAKAPR